MLIELPFDCILNILNQINNDNDLCSTLRSLPKNIYNHVKQNEYFWYQRTQNNYYINLNMLSIRRYDNRDKYIWIRDSLFHWYLTWEVMNDSHYWDKRMNMRNRLTMTHGILDITENSYRTAYKLVLGTSMHVTWIFDKLSAIKHDDPFDMYQFMVHLTFKYKTNEYLKYGKIVDYTLFINKLISLPNGLMSLATEQHYDELLLLLTLFPMFVEELVKIITMVAQQTDKETLHSIFYPQLIKLICENKILKYSRYESEERLFFTLDLLNFIIGKVNK